jgi:hypothetical protein
MIEQISGISKKSRWPRITQILLGKTAAEQCDGREIDFLGRFDVVRP